MGVISRRASLALLGSAPLLGAGLAHADETAQRGGISPRERIRDRYFPNVTLTTHEGRKVRFYDDLIKDKIVTINFIYAECEGVCPGITMNLARVQQALGKRVGTDIFMYSLTLQAGHDTPTVLREYAAMHGVGPGWQFLTGDPEDLELLRRRLGFVDPDPELDKDRANHVGNLCFGNEPMKLWAKCPGLAKPAQILRAIARVDLPKEKSS